MPGNTPPSEQEICRQLLTNAISNYRLGEDLVIPMLRDDETIDGIDVRKRSFALRKFISEIIERKGFSGIEVGYTTNVVTGILRMNAPVVAALLRDDLLDKPKLMIDIDSIKRAIANALKRYYQERQSGNLIIDAISDEQVTELTAIFSNEKYQVGLELDMIGRTNHTIILKTIVNFEDVSFYAEFTTPDSRFQEHLPVIPSRFTITVEEEGVHKLAAELKNAGEDIGVSTLDQIKAMVNTLADNIRDKKNGREQWFETGSQSKETSLRKVVEWLDGKAYLTKFETDMVLSLVKAVCASKRNSYGIFSPHSLREFNQRIADDGWKMAETNFSAKELLGLSDSEAIEGLIEQKLVEQRVKGMGPE
ncbi:hypothetical protein Lbir_1171 [Legionella birminghamensis]|uniref:Uncharacterized protein n=1 Tax=Legionella birminghamensis TaxID=28083 RepID=A0A378I5P2_9GAMM|nr:hypothetical protein [Legionella birminghamensis]KTC72396.1 hypothetical protein Lbir_1171 [Legionella birminghamensis]STX30528.1 Uncharacterised protein [Legionella birminghamensis]